MNTLLCPDCGSSSVTNHTGVSLLCGECGEENWISHEDCLAPAENGDVVAQCILGGHYLGENEIPADYERAMQWFTKALKKDYAPAYRHLGYMYERGYGVEKDMDKAVEYWKAGADKEDTYCIYNTGIMYLTYYEKDSAAIPYLLRAAEKELTEARTQLAMCYYHGRGVEKDHHQAFHWAKLAAEDGSPRAQLYMGFLYEDGRVMERNMAEAIEWFTRAADGGNAAAMERMAYYCLTGEFIEEDTERGMELRMAAAERGDWDAQCNLGWNYEAGNAVPQDLEAALYWYATSAENGLPWGMYQTGRCYTEGIGTGKDLYQAEHWLSAAVEHGCEEAQSLLDEVAEQLAKQEEKEREEEKLDDSVQTAGKTLKVVKFIKDLFS